MGLNIANCPRCGKVYARGIRDICNACQKEIEEEYGKCVEYLREHRGATMGQVSEATEVSIKQITKFIKEGRITLVSAPNLGYPCDACGTPIREGSMCDSCRKRLVQDVNRVKEADERRRQEEVNHKQSAAYKAIDLKNQKL